MKDVTILITLAFAIGAMILILNNVNKCEDGYHSMGNGTCMSNMEKM
jgi:hypothetical protein